MFCIPPSLTIQSPCHPQITRAARYRDDLPMIYRTASQAPSFFLLNTPRINSTKNKGKGIPGIGRKAQQHHSGGENPEAPRVEAMTPAQTHTPHTPPQPREARLWDRPPCFQHSDKALPSYYRQNPPSSQTWSLSRHVTCHCTLANVELRLLQSTSTLSHTTGLPNGWKTHRHV